MITLKNLKLYTPEDPFLGVGPAYLQDDEGRDWYKMHKEFSPDTWKIIVNTDGQVGGASKDVSVWYPLGLSIYELNRLPKDFFTAGPWLYVDGKFSKYEKSKMYEEDQKVAALNEKMISAKDIIDTLRIEKEYSDLSEEKAEQLKQASRDYISAKKELEASDGSNN